MFKFEDTFDDCNRKCGQNGRTWHKQEVNMTTRIEWCEETWNPITGCSKISEGCKNCYAERMAKRLAGRYGYPKKNPFKPDTFHPDKIDINLFAPGKRVFVCSMGDLFHEQVNIRGNEIREVFRCMAHHDNTFLLLTKRPDRMAQCIEYLYGDDFVEQMPHVWLGVTCENQRRADERIPILLQIPTAIRFVSVEPMLGPIHFREPDFSDHGHGAGWLYAGNAAGGPTIDWLIVGGESGPGARPMHPDWPRNLRDQCKAAEVPFFFKQWGEYTYQSIGRANGEVIAWKPIKVGKKKAGRLLDGRTWDEIPKESE